MSLISIDFSSLHTCKDPDRRSELRKNEKYDGKKLP